MDKQKFLDGFSDNNIRNYLYGLFTHAEAEAKCFAAYFGNWVCIDEVVEDPCGWGWEQCSSGCCIKAKSGDVKNGKELGAIFHEVFHSAFHNSPLWESDILHCKIHNGYGQWGDPFCDAFRYYMEKSEPNMPHDFCQKLEGYKNKSVKDILKGPVHKSQDIKYGIPASRIIKRAGDYSGFKALWKQLNQQWQQLGTQDDYFLERYFRYPMKHWQKKYP